MKIIKCFIEICASTLFSLDLTKCLMEFLQVFLNNSWKQNGQNHPVTDFSLDIEISNKTRRQKVKVKQKKQTKTGLKNNFSECTEFVTLFIQKVLFICRKKELAQCTMINKNHPNIYIKKSSILSLYYIYQTYLNLNNIIDQNIGNVTFWSCTNTLR